VTARHVQTNLSASVTTDQAVRVSRTFDVSRRVEIEGLLEGFNVTNRTKPSRETRTSVPAPTRRRRLQRLVRSPRSVIRGRCSSACA